MNNTPKHTWKAYKRSRTECTVEVESLGLRSVIARLRDEELCPEHGGSIEEHAVLIVKAVNNHEAMVKALQGLFEHCSMIHKHWGEGCNQKEADEAIKSARAALKDAEETTT